MSRMVRRFEVLLPLRFNDGTADSGAYLSAAKYRVKARFQQLDIWMTTYLIEVL